MARLQESVERTSAEEAVKNALACEGDVVQNYYRNVLPTAYPDLKKLIGALTDGSEGHRDGSAGDRDGSAGDRDGSAGDRDVAARVRHGTGRDPAPPRHAPTFATTAEGECAFFSSPICPAW